MHNFAFATLHICRSNNFGLELDELMQALTRDINFSWNGLICLLKYLKVISQVDFQYTFTQKISSSADQNVCPVGGDVDVVGKVVGGVAVSLIVIVVIIAVCYKVSCLSFRKLPVGIIMMPISN